MSENKEQLFKIELENIIKEVVEGEGFELWGIKYTVEYGKQIVRIYIDKENGVTISDCTSVTRVLAPRLDVEDIIPYTYNLEISSPGLDRPLFNLEQFKKYKGDEVKIKIHKDRDVKKHGIRGKITDVTEDSVVITDGSANYSIKANDISSAKLIYDFNKQR